MKCRIKKIDLILFLSVFFILLSFFFDYKFGAGVISCKFDALKKEVAFKTSRLSGNNFLTLLRGVSPDGDAYETKKKNT
ncbi:MAG TPA: hypothetical protein PLG34_06510 [Spirochaetota bacterium]|nr:MAG: hypothetical protein BWX91_00592 [Spirochaetes bacterium ADurb.Bin133]HNZ26304.1 hypothetical protein [Spirochaetota bacterium]HPY87615.1 hypothetical protein [Spirochaetota bacterium]HQB60177.1 hypothetical protein [Spirochaetota bacterium]